MQRFDRIRMNNIVKAVQIAVVEGQISTEAVQEVVSTLYTELHHAQPDLPSVSRDSHLDRDLGFDGLGRVELVLRLEQSFGVHLREAALGSVETVADLVALVNSAASDDPLHLTVAASVRPTLRPPITAPHTAKTLNEVLAWHAERHPDATHAVVLVDEQSHALTYAQLRDGARRVAGTLLHAGVQPGATVALMLPTAVEYLYTFVGVLLAGAIPAPIYPPTRAS